MAVPVRGDLRLGRRVGGGGVGAARATRLVLWPAVTTLLMLAITVGLGVWQLQRLEWKRGLLAEIDRGEATAPVPLGASPAAFRRVVVEGRFAPLVARYGTEVRMARGAPVMGAQLISPLLRPGAPPLLVDRGWAPLSDEATPPGGVVRVEGYVRPAEHVSQVGIGDDPGAKRFYTLDPVAIGAALGLGTVEPFTVVALGPAGTLPEPAAALPRPPNDHLTYALTWFAMSVALLGVFGVYVRQVLRRAAA